MRPVKARCSYASSLRVKIDDKAFTKRCDDCSRVDILLLFCRRSGFLLIKKVAGVFKGLASLYADKSIGHKTASGERYNSKALTCAHRTLPLGTKILVKNPKTGSSCVVVVNDRGPFRHDRIVDLSKAAGRKLGIHGVGTVRCYTGKSMTRVRS